MRRVVLSIAAAAAVTIGSSALAQDERGFEAFSTMNTLGVQSSPEHAATFSTDSPLRVLKIVTYHWNDGRGRRPGTIALRSSSGRIYGPWDAEGTDGQGDVRNASWEVYPDVVVPEGTYEVVDSDPRSWSQNTASGGRGMCSVTARYARRRGR